MPAPAYSLRSTGTAVVGQGTLTMGALTRVAGDLLVLPLVSRDNSCTLNAPNPPTGWTLLSPQVNVGWNYVFGRIATNTSADLPALTYSLDSGVAPHAWAQMAAFSGSVYNNLASIVHNGIDKHTPGSNVSILYDALTISLGNCLTLAIGTKNKTAASDGTEISALAGLTKIGSYDNGANNGSDVSVWWGYAQQTTATNMPTATQTLSAPTETLQYTSLYLALKTGGSAGAALAYNRKNVKG